MKTYGITVTKLRDVLSEMIGSGLGDIPLVVRTKMVNGENVMPIYQVGSGPMVVSDGRYGMARIIEEKAEGELVAFIETPDMIPVGYWKSETE